MVSPIVRNEIEKATNATYLVSASKTYFGIKGAEKVATWLASHGYRIVGMEGFRYDGSAIEPLPAYIADFSSSSHADTPPAAGGAAVRILKVWSNEVQFVEFVIQE